MRALNVLFLLIIMGCQTLNEQKSTQISEHKSPQKVVHCKGTKMVGWESPNQMTFMDRSSYESAKKRCPEKFPRSPCLVRFERVSENNYRATCGAALEDTNT